MNNLVSIITPVYNSERTLKQCIKGVRAQTYPHFEHILVDDGSADNSAGIIKGFAEKDPRLKYIKLERNSGAGVARNKGMAHAKGRYIAFVDSDDFWHPDKLRVQIDFMQRNDCPFSFTSYKIIDEQGKETGVIRKAKKKITYRQALYYNPVGCLTAVYDTDFFGKRFMPEIRKRQDYALWLELLKDTDACGIQVPLAYYRLNSNSISANKLNLLSYQWKLYKEVEGLNMLESLYYTLSSVMNRIFRDV